MIRQRYVQVKPVSTTSSVIPQAKTYLIQDSPICKHEKTPRRTMRYSTAMDQSEHTYGISNPADSLFGNWSGPAIGLMDLDAFFASVEMLDHPEWRGKPVIVGGPASKRGVVSTASYEARRFGVHSAMPSAQAERLCPQAIWTSGHFDRYREMSTKVMAILADETPYVQQVSIDEAFFDISPGIYARENPVAIASRIQDRVSELGISCSIGLGINKTVAKIASERDKPKGLTVVTPGTERTFLAPLPVKSMSGIGKSAEERLKRYRIFTLGQLANADDMQLRAVFGSNAEMMRRRAAGLERSQVTSIDAADDVKSIGNERTFAKDLTDRSDVDAALALLGESVGRRLRAKRLIGSTVTVKIKYSYGSGRTIQRQLPHPTDDEHVFVKAAQDLLDQIWTETTHVRLLGLTMSGFDNHNGIQTDLFCTVDERGAESSEQRDLAITLDEVRKKFGSGSVTYGRAARFDDAIVRHQK